MKGKSTIDNINDLLQKINEIKIKRRLNKATYAAIVFFYFQKGYDSVPHEKMIKKLENFGWPWNITKIIKSMFESFTLQYNRRIIKTSKGLVQGSVLSPLLFNIFLNDLMILLRFSIWF